VSKQLGRAGKRRRRVTNSFSRFEPKGRNLTGEKNIGDKRGPTKRGLQRDRALCFPRADEDPRKTKRSLGAMSPPDKREGKNHADHRGEGEPCCLSGPKRRRGPCSATGARETKRAQQKRGKTVKNKGENVKRGVRDWGVHLVVVSTGRKADSTLLQEAKGGPAGERRKGKILVRGEKERQMR